MEEKNFNLVRNFIDDFVEEDLAAGKVKDNIVCTRVPPEPNGYLHLGHVKSVCINFGIARRNGGKCFLYFDDTNPVKEKDEFVQAIKNDINWLGFDWDKLYFASDHYEDLYKVAEHLIEKGKAFVCDLSPQEMKDYRGSLTEAGKESPYRNRSVEENLDLFRRMKKGEFPEGSRTLRAKIDMSSPILCMRDPVIYRIMFVSHHRTGDKWCIYPMYDFASPLLDAFEGVTHSLCGPEFEERRPLYNWSVENADLFPYPPRQIEFAKINVKNVILGKRYLKKLVEDKGVSGWDDPRMPTIAGMRRRGYTPSALKDFVNMTGVAKAQSESDYSVLEHCVREDLKTLPLRMAVKNPIKLVIDNYCDSEVLKIADTNEPDSSVRDVLFTKELYIDGDDFMAEPIPKYFRLFAGNDVRLKGAYIVHCTGCEVVDGKTVVHADYYADSKSGSDCTRKCKGTIHWVSAQNAVPLTFRLYDQLLDENAPADAEIADKLNPESLVVAEGYGEAALENTEVGDRFQFIRQGYFIKDADSKNGKSVWNRIVGLKDKFNVKK